MDVEKKVTRDKDIRSEMKATNSSQQEHPAQPSVYAYMI